MYPTGRTGVMNQEKLLDKLAKLKAMAESAQKIGSTAEAESFAAMLQQLLLKHKLAMSDVELRDLETEEPVEVHRIDYKAYPDVPLRKTRVQWIEDLAYVIAKAHFCRILVHSGSSCISLVGRRSDTACAEYMLVTLQRAVERLADAAYAEFTIACVRECERCGGEKSDHRPRCPGVIGTVHGYGFKPNWAKARGFRPAFIRGFIERLLQRYREAERVAVSDTSTALVRVSDARQAVDDFIKQGRNIKPASELARQTAANAHGTRRGIAAANEVELTTRALEGAASRRPELR